MPAAPLPPELRRFVEKPRHAVVGTVRADGTPVTTPCWYGLDDEGRLVLSMGHDSHRLAHIRANPRVALTVLALVVPPPEQVRSLSVPSAGIASDAGSVLMTRDPIGS